MLTTLITLFVLGIVGLVAVSVVLAIVGTMIGLAVGLAGFLAFKILPIVLIGWGVLKLIERGSNKRQISVSDQQWLDG